VNQPIHFLKKLLSKLNINWSQKENQGNKSLEQKNLIFLKKEKITTCFICSYPRSGNTWLRYLLTDCLLQQKKYTTNTHLEIHPDEVIPDIQAHELSKIYKAYPFKPFYVKSHIDPLTLGLQKNENWKAIYIYRNPIDSLTSYFYFHARYPELKAKNNKGINRFVLDELPNWINHVRNATNNKFRKTNCYLIQYEDFHANSEKNLKHICDWLNLPLSIKDIFNAAEKSKFEKLRAREVSFEKDTTRVLFFRKGLVGEGKKELKKDTISVIEAQTTSLLKKAAAKKN